MNLFPARINELTFTQRAILEEWICHRLKPVPTPQTKHAELRDALRSETGIYISYLPELLREYGFTVVGGWVLAELDKDAVWLKGQPGCALDRGLIGPTLSEAIKNVREEVNGMLISVSLETLFEALTNKAYFDSIPDDLIGWVKDLMDSSGFSFRDGVFYEGNGPWLECGKAPFFKRQLTTNGARLVYPKEKPYS